MLIIRNGEIVVSWKVCDLCSIFFVNGLLFMIGVGFFFNVLFDEIVIWSMIFEKDRFVNIYNIYRGI